MPLDSLFSGCDVIRDLSTDVPSVWHDLLAIPRRAALLLITESLGLSQGSCLSDAIVSSGDFGVIAPRRRRDRLDSRMWTLAIMYSQSHSLLFNCPASDFLKCSMGTPYTYLRVVTQLGSLRFDKYSGHLIWPAMMQQIASDIHLVTDSHDVLPYFDHKTGDYDCWLDGDYSTTYFFNHETVSFNKYSQGEFGTWLEKRFKEYAMTA